MADKISFLAFLIVSLFCGNAYAVDAQYWARHFEAKIAVMNLQTPLLGTGDVVLYGDSNTEAFWWNQNGGCQLLNVGMAGSRISHLAQYAETVASSTRPKIVHIMAGTNNLTTAFRTSPEGQAEWSTMQADMVKMVRAFKSRGAKVVVWPVPPFSSGFGSIADRDAINLMWYNVTVSEGILWDWWWPNQIMTGSSGPGFTLSGLASPGALLNDGVHLSASSQISRFYRMEVWRAQTGVTCN